MKRMLPPSPESGQTSALPFMNNANSSPPKSVMKLTALFERDPR